MKLLSMNPIVAGLIAVGVLFVFMFLKEFLKSLKDPDVKEASYLRMSITNYRKYKEIWDEQMDCHRRGVEPPNRLKEIPNMNEWRRFGEWQFQKSRINLEEEFDKNK